MRLNLLDLRLILVYPFVFILLPILWPVIYFYKCFVIILARLTEPKLRNIVDGPSVNLIEDFGRINLPKCVEVCGLLLDGEITIKELQRIFIRNVLEATLNEINQTVSVLRYPELQQYQTTFMGYVFWKDEEDFEIDSHIFEGQKDWRNFEEAKIHEELHNKPFPLDKSPWEIILLKNYQPNANVFEETRINDLLNRKPKRKSLILLRFHHSMLDGQSIFKLIVEGLGQQPYKKPGRDLKPPNNLSFYLTFPQKFSYMLYSYILMTARHWRHPLKQSNLPPINKQFPVRVSFSEKISLKDVKSISKQFAVSPSSVILSIIAGALKQTMPELEDFPCGYILPKANHPPTFTNHLYASVLMLPSGSNSSPRERLRLSHKTLENVKSSGAGFFLETLIKPVHSFINPLRELINADLIGQFIPVGITNNAISGEGIFIGEGQGISCEDVTFSVGTLQGVTGVTISVASYKDSLRFVICADQNIISCVIVENIAQQISNEFSKLLEFSINAF